MRGISPVSSAMAAGMYGLRTATKDAATAARRISRGEGDLPGNAVDLLEAKQSHGAAASVLKTATDMQESVLDILI
ncbi:MAG: hypothetical protein ACLFVU_06790 [Phycisphaerae bacterium]